MTINGHFWITDEKTGEVIYDPHFKYTDFLREVHDATNKKIYEPCTMERQREAIREYVAKPFTTIMKNKNNTPPNFWTPRYLQCAVNVAKYKAQGNKGKIVYGNMGYERKDGTIWYNFNEDYDEDKAQEMSQKDWKRWEAGLTKKEKKKKAHFYIKHEQQLERALMETQFTFLRWGQSL